MPPPQPPQLLLLFIITLRSEGSAFSCAGSGALKAKLGWAQSSRWGPVRRPATPEYQLTGGAFLLPCQQGNGKCKQTPTCCVGCSMTLLSCSTTARRLPGSRAREALRSSVQTVSDILGELLNCAACVTPGHCVCTHRPCALAPSRVYAHAAQRRTNYSTGSTKANRHLVRRDSVNAAAQCAQSAC